MLQIINEETHDAPPNSYAIKTTAKFDEFVKTSMQLFESEIKHAIENHTLKMHSPKLNNFRFINLNEKSLQKLQIKPRLNS